MEEFLFYSVRAVWFLKENTFTEMLVFLGGLLDCHCTDEDAVS